MIASLITAALYAKDKRAARLNRQRTPENTLLVWCVLGGWPGGLVASRMLRHKTAKMSYRISFVISIIAHLSLVAWIAWRVMRISPFLD